MSDTKILLCTGETVIPEAIRVKGCLEVRTGERQRWTVSVE